jgi:hypothetical protein
MQKPTIASKFVPAEQLSRRYSDFPCKGRGIDTRHQRPRCHLSFIIVRPLTPNTAHGAADRRHNLHKLEVSIPTHIYSHRSSPSKQVYVRYNPKRTHTTRGRLEQIPIRLRHNLLRRTYSCIH